jgi:arylsulfatase A-like enzyme
MKTPVSFVGLALWALASFAPTTAAAAQPNLLFIAIDDLNHWVGHLGRHPQTKTPNLDRLAATGVNLTDFRACPTCSPPWSRYGLPAPEATLPGLLAAAGYGQRGIVGKHDLAEKNNGAARHPEIVAKIDACLKTARSDSPDWMPARDAAK